MTHQNDSQANLDAIKAQILDCEKKFGRPLHSAQLVAASKSQTIAKVQSAYDAGIRAFGENYLQEALAKMAALPKDIEWHFIGSVQSNKTKKIAEHFAWVESVADMKIAKRLHEQRPAHLPPLNICIEVNISNEATKSGINPTELPALATLCQSLSRLKLRGLMAIPMPAADFAKARQAFHQVYLLWQTMKSAIPTIDTLSMGMSDDFEAAIAEGSTMVRIGTRLFGGRPKR